MAGDCILERFWSGQRNVIMQDVTGGKKDNDLDKDLTIAERGLGRESCTGWRMALQEKQKNRTMAGDNGAGVHLYCHMSDLD